MIRPVFTEIALFLAPFVVYAIYLVATKAALMTLASWTPKVLASLGIFGGISALFIGLVFVVLHAVLSGDIVFNRAGTALLIVAIPMILLGSIFVDEVEGKE